MASPVCRCADFCSATFAQWTAGASRHPVFPAPSDRGGCRDEAKLGRDEPRGCGGVSASWYARCRRRCRSLLRHCERKRSNPESPRGKTLDCFVARAPRNDVERAGLAIRCRAIDRSFTSNCNPRVQEVLIGGDLEVMDRVERRPRAPRLMNRVHKDQWNVIASPLPKAPKWCFSAFHEPVVEKRAVRAALQACP
jgi:hypothetical protein